MLKNISLLILAALTLTFIPVFSVVAKEVTFGTVDWPPYYGSKLEEKGFVSAITREAYNEQGYEFKVRFMPFSRAMKTAKLADRDLDGVLGAWYNDERASKFKYSEPIVDTKNVLIARKDIDTTSYDSLKDLKSYTIGVSRGWAYSEEFDNANFLDKQVANDQIINMRKLFSGRIDIMAAEQRVFRYEAKQNGKFDLDKVTVMTPPLSQTPIYNIVSNNHSNRDELIKAFNKGLETIKNNGTYNNILSRLDQDI